MKRTATLSSKAQITIPAWVRRRLGLRAGSRLVVRVEEGTVVLVPEQVDVLELQGSCRGLYGDPDAYIRELRREWDRY